MDNLQYLKVWTTSCNGYGFKPYYKWIIFNIIVANSLECSVIGFKPYYKWIIFNIMSDSEFQVVAVGVLNLIING